MRRRIQSRSKTPTLAREDEALSERSVASDPPSQARRSMPKLGRLRPPPIASPSSISIIKSPAFTADEWSEDKPLRRSVEHDIDIIAQTIMTHFLLNPRSGLPANQSQNVARIIESHSRLRQELQSVQAQLEDQKETERKMQTELQESRSQVMLQQYRIQQLESRLESGNDSSESRQYTYDISGRQQQTVYEFLSGSAPHAFTTFSSNQPQKASPQKLPQLFNSLSRRGQPSSLLEAKDSFAGETFKGDASKSTPNIAQLVSSSGKQKTRRQRSASFSDLPAAFVDYSPQELRETTVDCPEPSSLQVSPVTEQPVSPTAPSFPKGRMRTSSINSVSGSQTRIPSPVYPTFSQARPRRDRSNSSLSTVRRRSPVSSSVLPTPFVLHKKRDSVKSSSSGTSTHNDHAKTAAQVASQRSSIKK